jgi:hypothetical protein
VAVTSKGFGLPDYATRLADAIKAVGGRLDYVAFDEPFANGHLYDGPRACRWSAEEVARQIAEFVAELRRSFPHVVAGDIEPLWPWEPPATFEAWQDTYARVTGTRLPFFDLDVDFNRPDWVGEAKQLESFTRRRGTRFGLIYIGDGSTNLSAGRKSPRIASRATKRLRACSPTMRSCSRGSTTRIACCRKANPERSPG